MLACQVKTLATAWHVGTFIGTLERKNEKLAHFWHVGMHARCHVNHAGIQSRWNVNHAGTYTALARRYTWHAVQ